MKSLASHHSLRTRNGLFSAPHTARGFLDTRACTEELGHRPGQSGVTFSVWGAAVQLLDGTGPERGRLALVCAAFLWTGRPGRFSFAADGVPVVRLVVLNLGPCTNGDADAKQTIPVNALLKITTAIVPAC